MLHRHQNACNLSTAKILQILVFMAKILLFVILIFYILNPIDRIQTLCASIRSPQFSSPLSMIL